MYIYGTRGGDVYVRRFGAECLCVCFDTLRVGRPRITQILFVFSCKTAYATATAATAASADRVKNIWWNKARRLVSRAVRCQLFVPRDPGSILVPAVDFWMIRQFWSGFCSFFFYLVIFGVFVCFWFPDFFFTIFVRFLAFDLYTFEVFRIFFFFLIFSKDFNFVIFV